MIAFKTFQNTWRELDIEDKVNIFNLHSNDPYDIQIKRLEWDTLLRLYPGLSPFEMTKMLLKKNLKESNQWAIRYNNEEDWQFVDSNIVDRELSNFYIEEIYKDFKCWNRYEEFATLNQELVYNVILSRFENVNKYAAFYFSKLYYESYCDLEESNIIKYFKRNYKMILSESKYIKPHYANNSFSFDNEYDKSCEIYIKAEHRYIKY